MQNELDWYFDAVETLGRDLAAQRIETHRYLEAQKAAGTNPSAGAALIRRNQLTEKDREDLRGYLTMGFFPDDDEDVRLAWFALNADVSAAARRIELQRQCIKYAPDQPLFQAAPALFSSIRQGKGKPELELIDESFLKCIGDGEVFDVGRGFAKLVPALNSRIVTWARETYPNARRFVRLDPFEHYAEAPQQMLFEAAVVPADPTWLAGLTLYGRNYAQYDLVEGERDDLWDYLVRRVRRLEVIATRRTRNEKDGDLLSMMVEELPASDHPSGVMLGLCMHLDTKAAPGTPVQEARLQHLDLAINCYEGDKRKEREATTFERGKVKASYRTHLYRIEDVPFTALFDFATMFFRSRRLVQQWIADFHPGAISARDGA